MPEPSKSVTIKGAPAHAAIFAFVTTFVTVLLAFLKLFHVGDLSWFEVLTPLLALAALSCTLAVFVVVTAVALLIGDVVKKGNSK